MKSSCSLMTDDHVDEDTRVSFPSLSSSAAAAADTVRLHGTRSHCGRGVCALAFQQEHHWFTFQCQLIVLHVYCMGDFTAVFATVQKHAG